MEKLRHLRQEGRLEEALATVDQLLKQKEEPRLCLERADLLGRLRRFGEAIEQLESLTPTQRGDFGQALYAGLLERQGRLAESESIFEELALRPQLPPVTARRVLKYLEDRDPRRALLWARRQQGPEAFRQQAQVLLKAKKTEEALQLLSQAVEDFPEQPGLMNDFVRLRLKGLPPKTVAEELKTLLSLEAHQQNPGLRDQYIQALRDLKEWQQALEEVQESLRLGGNPHYLRALSAYILRDQGEIKKALDLMEELMNENPADHHVVGAYCKTCREHGEGERARAFIATEASRDRSKARWWGALRKAFGK